MSIAVEFSKQLGAALDALAQDEWAVVSLRERVVEGIDSATAFASVTEFLDLARTQTDPYAFASCCWVTSTLAELSNTTEMPLGLAEAIQQALTALTASRAFGAEAELRRLADWYRFERLPT